MTDPRPPRALPLLLRLLGALFLFGFYPLTVFWPTGWAWHPGQSDYLQMMIGLYATLGVFLFVAARDPEHHLGLISFTIWSSLVHGAIMAVQAFRTPGQMTHLAGDVPALFLAAALLGRLSPRAFTLPFPRRAA